MAVQFPPKGIKEDSSKYSVEFKESSISTETDGDYTYTRPRTSRPPKIIVNTGFTDINKENRDLLVSFAQNHGKFGIFSYQMPDTRQILNVRFTTLPKFTYAGAGGEHRYNVTDIVMEEV